jgi:hypothetical protein
MTEVLYYNKYLKYKNKYISLKEMKGGVDNKQNLINKLTPFIISYVNDYKTQKASVSKIKLDLLNVYEYYQTQYNDLANPGSPKNQGRPETEANAILMADSLYTLMNTPNIQVDEQIKQSIISILMLK